MLYKEYWLKREDFKFINVPDPSFDANKINLDQYKAVIVAGSGAYDLSKLPPQVQLKVESTQPLINNILKGNKPSLFICFGHQLLAETLGGEVETVSKMAESGSVEISIEHEHLNDLIFKIFLLSSMLVKHIKTL